MCACVSVHCFLSKSVSLHYLYRAEVLPDVDGRKTGTTRSECVCLCVYYPPSVERLRSGRMLSNPEVHFHGRSVSGVKCAVGVRVCACGMMVWTDAHRPKVGCMFSHIHVHRACISS